VYSLTAISFRILIQLFHDVFLGNERSSPDESAKAESQWPQTKKTMSGSWLVVATKLDNKHEQSKSIKPPFLGTKEKSHARETKE
jgi:hypothetical protein